MAPAGGRSPFVSTRWSLVLKIGTGRSPETDDALAALCTVYWYPLYGFLRAGGHSADDAQDLTQGFFLHVLEKRVFTRANPARGRFRSFLLASLKNFAANEYNKRQALKRSPGTPALSLEFETGEGRFQLEPSTTETPEKVFDRRWALVLLERVLGRLRDGSPPGRLQQFDQLKIYLTGEPRERPYAVAAAELGMSEGAVKVAVHRMRRQFREILHEEIAATVSSPAEVDDEIRHLWLSVGR